MKINSLTCAAIKYAQYFINSESLTLSIGDVVATQAKNGHDIGMVTVIDLSGKEVTARYRCRGAL